MRNKPHIHKAWVEQDGGWWARVFDGAEMVDAPLPFTHWARREDVAEFYRKRGQTICFEGDDYDQ